MPGPRPRPEPPAMFVAYLRRRPEANPWALLPRSAFALARAGILLHGLWFRGWPIAWFGGFLAAEWFLVVRLATVGDRFSPGPSLDPEGRRRRTALGEILWAVLSLVLVYAVGAVLDGHTGLLGGSARQGADPAAGLPATMAALFSRPSWPVIGYIATLFIEFSTELHHARGARQPFLSASTLTAVFFFLFLILLVVPAVFGTAFLAESLVPEAVALLLVGARAGADLAVLWMPLWWEPFGAFWRSRTGRENAAAPSPPRSLGDTSRSGPGRGSSGRR